MQAQTTKNTIDLLATTNAKKPTKTNKNDNNSDFLSMVLDAAANKANAGEKISEKDVKDIVKSINMQNQTKNEASAQIDLKLEQELDETTKNTLFENANFMQLLQVLEILNGAEVSKYPNFSDKIANFLSEPQNVIDLAGVKSVTDLIDLAKKFDLGLENLTITNEDVQNLDQIFKNLAQKEFFTPIAPKPIFTNELKNQVEQSINLAQKNEPAQLNQLLQEISKQSKVQDDETVQRVDETVVKMDEPNDDKTKKTKNIAPDIKDIKSQKAVNLQNLLYPDRQNASEQGLSGENQSSNEEQNPLNIMVRDISRAASHQMQEKSLVRETLSNFSENLKEQIQNYKAPFTRVNLTLNPLNLGEVEITMVTRGNNLHINFNSTTTAMNLFLQNQAEFKNSLVNMGFTELEMNFSDQNQKQEQGRETYKRANNQLASEQQSNEVEQNLLEIIIPRYI